MDFNTVTIIGLVIAMFGPLCLALIGGTRHTSPPHLGLLLLSDIVLESQKVKGIPSG